MKTLLLINPNFKYPSSNIPLGLISIASYLNEKFKDIKISILDTSFDRNFKTVVSRIKDFKPDIVGIYMDTLMYKDALKTAKIAKNYNCNVVIGGPHAILKPETVINNEFVDAICIGEGEETFEEYIEEFYNKKDFSNVKGIWFKENGEIIKNASRPLINMDKLARPEFFDLDLNNYAKNWVTLDTYDINSKGIYLMATRGCPYKCKFCQPTLEKVTGKGLRVRSANLFVEDLKHLNKKYGISSFVLTDDNLTSYKKWIREFCDLLKKSKLNVKWSCLSRVDTIDEKTIRIMKEAGLVKIAYGIESFNQRILDLYDKRINLNQIKNAINLSKKYGIITLGFFMLGGPSETREEIKNTIDFATNSKLDEATFTITTPVVSSFLEDVYVENKWELPEKFEDIDYYKAKRPKAYSEDVSNFQLSIYQKVAYIKFYFHPKRIKKTLALLSPKKYKKSYYKLRSYLI